MGSRISSFFRSLLRRRRLEDDIEDELAFHLKARRDDLMRQSLSRREAERQARLEFGAVEAYREECREARGLRWADELWRNVWFAARILRRSPGFALSAVLTLGLCIGANTAVFSFVDAVLLRPLPYPEPDRLFLVGTHFQSEDGEDLRQSQDGRSWEIIRDNATLVQSAVFSGWATGVNLVTEDRAHYVSQQRVGSGFFNVLGVRPLVGREFSQEEDQANGPAAVILGYALWQNLFAKDSSAVGRTVQLRGEPYTIVGVMPPDFQTGSRADLWTPLKPSTTGEGSGTNYQVLVRLNEGINLEKAQAQLGRLSEALDLRRRGSRIVSSRFELIHLQRGLTNSARMPLIILWSAAGVVLLIGCVNIAGLLLARSGRRTREIAIRSALGGGRGAVVRQMLTESLILAAAGGVVGVIFGYWGKNALELFIQGQFNVWQSVGLNGRVLAVTAAVTVGSSVAFGLLPAIRACTVDIRPALGEGEGRGMTAAARWPRRALVVVEVALGLALLVAAGTLVRTFLELRALEPGFDPDHVMTAQLSLQDARYATVKDLNSLIERSLSAIRELPGVQAAGIGLTLPYERSLNFPFMRLGGPQADERGQITDLCYVTPGYFEALRIPLLYGRALDKRDRTDSAPVVVVNEAFVQRYLSRREPIGSQLQIANQPRRVVGIVGDVQQRSSWGDFGPLDAIPTVYMPASQTADEFLKVVHTWFSPRWLVRTVDSPHAVIPGMRQAIASVDPMLPFSRFETMDEVMAASWADQRVQAAMLTVLAGLALLLAAVGIYGLIANSVVERTREVGIRMALGATGSQAVRTVALPGIWLALIGIAIGSALSWATVDVLQSLIWGVSIADPLTFVVVALLLLITSALASFVPSLQIARLDLAQTLRDE